MPTIVDYMDVTAAMKRIGFICNYHNSGSFAPSADSDAAIVGWLTGEDATIRPDMRRLTHIVAAGTLLDRLVDIWLRDLAGPLWIMPASHWAFELTYGNADWLPDRLRSIGVDAALIQDRNDASAIAFEPAEKDATITLLGDLLTRSAGSDFTAAWPGHPAVAMLHHHQQIWWRTTDRSRADRLREYVV